MDAAQMIPKSKMRRIYRISPPSCKGVYNIAEKRASVDDYIAKIRAL